MALATAAAPKGNDPVNPSCPKTIDWGADTPMTISVRDDIYPETKVLIAEGAVDKGFPDRLKKAIDADPMIGEVWLKSRGGDARAGNAAGRVIRSNGLATRIPKGWGCFSACNFLFMGGLSREVDPGGLFIVHMFTHTQDRDTINLSIEQGTESTVALIGDIEQQSALLASEDNDFLIRMGVSRLLLTEVMYRQQAVAAKDAPTRYCLSQAELVKYNVKSAVAD